MDDIKSSFELFLPEFIEGIILEMTNLEGKRMFGDTWSELDLVDLQAYMVSLDSSRSISLKQCKYKSLWDVESGRPKLL